MSSADTDLFIWLLMENLRRARQCATLLTTLGEKLDHRGSKYPGQTCLTGWIVFNVYAGCRKCLPDRTDYEFQLRYD